MWEKVGIVIMIVEIVGRVTMIGDTSAMCACITEVAWFQDEGTGASSPTVGLRTPPPPSRNRPDHIIDLRLRFFTIIKYKFS